MRGGTSRRLVAAAVAATALALGTAVSADAGGGRYTDRQVVQLTRADAVRGAGGLDLHLTARSAVSATNLAVATTSCSGCRATAVSFQVVVADRAPSSVDATNLAYAKDDDCAYCEAQAYAYQFVLAYQDDVRLSTSGRQQLARIDDALRALARSSGTPDQVLAAVDGYASQVADILGSEVRIRPVVRRQVERSRGR